jgi:hypothetical protein
VYIVDQAGKRLNENEQQRRGGGGGGGEIGKEEGVVDEDRYSFDLFHPALHSFHVAPAQLPAAWDPGTHPDHEDLFQIVAAVCSE